jgi:predicted aldo/keto reductase-like oxidoreductase
MDQISRRGFLNKSSALAAGCALPRTSEATVREQTNDAPSIKRYKPFGKTGWKVGDISAGAGQSEPALTEYIFERGVTLIDTAYVYTGHEETIGKVLPAWRDKIFVVDKWEPELVTPTVTKAALLEALDVSLQRLNTTYVDCMMLQAIGHPDLGDITRIQNPAIYEAYDEAKKLGKIRFTGASSCGPKVLEEMEWGIDNDRFDVVLLGANFLTHGLERILEKAKAKGVATMAMKTMTTYKKDLNIRGLMDKNTNARQAVIKYILASDLFDTLCIGMRNYDMVSEYLSASGTTSLSTDDDEALEMLGAVIGTKYCRPGCGECYGTCPNDVPIWDILRYKMYFENYGDEKYAMEKYRKIPTARQAAVCTDCNGLCEEVCAYGLPVRDRLLEAHQQLTFA